MKREQRILHAAMQSRGAFTAIAPVAEEADMSRQGWVLWQMIEEYYTEDPHVGEVDATLITDKIKVEYPKHTEQFMLLLAEPDVAVSATNAVKEYLTLKELGIKNRLSEALLSNADKGEVMDLMDRLKTINDAEADEDTTIITGMGIDDVIKVFTPENVIPVHPPLLADKLDGGLIPGNQVAIYANTEVGKTLFAINMAAHLLMDGYKVLYLGNEDAMRMMLLRFFTNLSGMDKHQVLAAPKEAETRAIANGYDNLIFLDGQPGSVAEIRRAVEKYKPAVVFIDQMANMEMGGLSKTEKNEELSIALRKIAKRYDIASVIIHQADNDAHGKLKLEKNNMHWTNVGVQGQMDVMIGIGMNAEFEQQGKRMICLTKNKNSGDHSVFPVSIRQETSEVLE